METRKKLAGALIRGLNDLPFPRAAVFSLDDEVATNTFDNPNMIDQEPFNRICADLATILWSLGMAKFLLREDWGRSMFPFDRRAMGQVKRRECLVEFVKEAREPAAYLGLT